MNQHYLPECYLKEFCNKKGHFYSIDNELLTKGILPKPRITYPKEACKQKDYFTITPQFKEIYPRFKDLDALYLENKFKTYEDWYPKLLTTLKSGQPGITFNDAEFLLHVLTDFRDRNLFFRDNSVQVKKNTLNKMLAEEKHGTHILSSNDKEDIERVLSDPHFNKNSHLLTLILKYHSKQDENGDLFKLLTSKWCLCISDNKFITSDNPGYFIHNGRYLYELPNVDFSFIMPITPNLCLYITDHVADLDSFRNSYKTIDYIIADENVLDIYNRGLTYHMNRYLYAESIDAITLFTRTMRTNI
ncbi:DUF4238 domain-containing protein [Mucilaginibacter lappiensis]|jgi:hypothetical protein|uniref:DUF4238 domain-containing protein n=1 Tax=Mucilaginibacter lappiensis TaxID=354630 RepID=UPI003D1BA606